MQTETMNNSEPKEMMMVKTAEKAVVEEASIPAVKKVFTLDLDKVVARARQSYGKSEAGLAKKLTTGSKLSRPTEDKDFILWTGSDFWHKLTKLKGIPFGKIVQFSGKMDSGKSSMSYVFMASAQKSGYYVILLDSEGKFQSVRYDKQIGGDSKQLLVADTNSTEEGGKSVAYLVHAIKEQDKNAKILIVLDSIGALITRSENGSDDDESMGKQPGVQAKEINWLMKKFNRLIFDYQNKETGEQTIAVLVVNQVYVNLMSPGYSEKGGQGLAYASSLILQLSRKKDLIKVKSGEKIKYGIVSRAKVKKNHLFDGEESLAETDIVVSAGGIQGVDEAKKTASADVSGWDAPDEEG